MTTVADERDLEWERREDVGREASEMPRAIVQSAFALPRPAEGRSVGSARLGDGDRAVIVVTAVRDGTLDGLTENQRTMLARSMRARNAGIDFDAVRGMLREEYGVTRKLGTLGE